MLSIHDLKGHSPAKTNLARRLKFSQNTEYKPKNTTTKKDIKIQNSKYKNQNSTDKTSNTKLEIPQTKLKTQN